MGAEEERGTWRVDRWTREEGGGGILAIIQASLPSFHRIRRFWGLLDPDPIVRGMDPDPDPSFIMQNNKKKLDSCSVPDPDPHVFGPPGSGSGSTSQSYGSGSRSIFHHAKIVRKTLIPIVL